MKISVRFIAGTEQNKSLGFQTSLADYDHHMLVSDGEN